MWEAAFWGAISASSLLIGAAVALRWQTPATDRWIGDGLRCWRADQRRRLRVGRKGVRIERGHATPAFGLAAGALVYFGGDWYIDSRGGKQRKDIGGEGATGNARSIMLGTVLDGIPESIVVGGSLVAGAGVSVAMVAATFLSNFPEAVGATVGLKKGGTSARRLMGLWFAIVVVSAASAAIGYAVLDDAPVTSAPFSRHLRQVRS